MAEVIGSIAGPVLGALIGSDSADSAAETQAGAADRATALQKQMFDTTNQQQAPYRSIGYGALNQLATLLGVQPVAADGNTPGLASDPSSAQFGSLMQAFRPGDLEQEPGYQFRLGQGMKAINNSAGLRGGLYSGATLKALSDYGQNSASQEYQNAFNRDAATKDRFLNYLTSAAGIGSNAAGRTQAAGENFAMNAGNNMMGAANVQGAASIARGNAWGDAVNNVFALGKRNKWWGLGGTQNDPDKPYWE